MTTKPETPAPSTQTSPGRRCAIKRLGHLRPARILASVDGTAVLEYVLPTGTTSLAFCPADCGRVEGEWLVIPADLVKRNPYGYLRLPRRYLEQMIENGIEWSGKSRSGKAPTPQELLDDAGTHPGQGWTGGPDLYEKTYFGHRLTLNRGEQGWEVSVGELRVGTVNVWDKATSGPWLRGARMAHDAARRLGRGIL